VTDFWTEERQAILEHMADAGQTSGMIAERLGISRSAVTGRAARTNVRLPGSGNAKSMRGAIASSAKASAKRAKPSLPQVLSAPISPVSDAGAGKKAEDLRDTVAMLGAAPEAVAIPVAINPQPSGDMQGQSSAGVTLFDLRRDSCRFPIAGEGIGTIFCGEKAEEGRSYCPVCYPRTITKSAGGTFVFNKRNDEREAA